MTRSWSNSGCVSSELVTETLLTCRAVAPMPVALSSFQMGPLEPSERPYSTDSRCLWKTNLTSRLATSSAVAQCDARHAEAGAMYDAERVDLNDRLLRLWVCLCHFLCLLLRGAASDVL